MFWNKSKKLESELLATHEKLEDRDAEIARLQQQVEDLENKLSDTVEDYEARLKTTNVSDQNEVKLLISDDLLEVTPVIRYKDSAFDVLVQKQYISDGHDNSLQLGLMIVAHEALTQIVEAFAEDINKG